MCSMSVPKPEPSKVLRPLPDPPGSPSAPAPCEPLGPPAPSRPSCSSTTSVLAMRGLDDVLTRGHQLVGLEHDVRARRLRRLLPGLQVRLIDAQDAHELDAVHGVHDAVELALVECAAERPAAAAAGRVPAHERVQVRVE